MTTIKGEAATFAQPSDLRPLLSVEGPCLSVYMPLSNASREGKDPNAKQNELRWRRCLEQLTDEQIARFEARGRELVKSVRDWSAIAPEPGGESGQARSIGVFRAPDTFQVVTFEEQVAERVHLGDAFYIRPLLRAMEVDRQFYILALSQKHTRLLRCTVRTMEEVPLLSDVALDFDKWMNQAKPDHRALNNAMAASAQGGAGPSALAPKGSDREAKDEYLSHFFKQIDRGITEALKGKTDPVVLCAVEYEIPLYRGVNTCKHLVADDVRGAPNGMSSDEMRAGAIEAIQNAYAAQIDDAVAEWNHRVGPGASSHMKDIVTAAHDGRVNVLLISESQEIAGQFNETTNSVQRGADNEELLNDAAVQTILHAGTVLVAPNAKMPNGAPAAAIFRY